MIGVYVSKTLTQKRFNGNIPVGIKRRVGRMPALRMLAMWRPRNMSRNENIHDTHLVS